jgi:hypothetical protein
VGARSLAPARASTPHGLASFTLRLRAARLPLTTATAAPITSMHPSGAVRAPKALSSGRGRAAWNTCHTVASWEAPASNISLVAR